MKVRIIIPTAINVISGYPFVRWLYNMDDSAIHVAFVQMRPLRQFLYLQLI